MRPGRQLKCVRCSLAVTDDNHVIISPDGEVFHQRCWQVQTSAEQIRTSRKLISRTKQFVRDSQQLVRQSRELRDPDPICPVCLQPIKARDLVTGLRDDLIHEACDYTRLPKSRPTGP